MREHEIFAAAIKLTGEQRSAFIAAACRQVDALLRARDELGGLLPWQFDERLEQTQSVPVAVAPGTLIGGRYKLPETIGEGGMRTVWMAEQRQPIKRKVAVKLVKAGMDSGQHGSTGQCLVVGQQRAFFGRSALEIAHDPDLPLSRASRTSNDWLTICQPQGWSLWNKLSSGSSRSHRSLWGLPTFCAPPTGRRRTGGCTNWEDQAPS